MGWPLLIGVTPIITVIITAIKFML